MVMRSQLISHRFRGFSEYENTIAGLRSALDFGVEQVEFDIRVTRCGTPLIYHDESAKTVTGELQHISNIMAKDRHRLGGAFAHMPSAESLFEAAASHENKARLLIDMKDAGFEDMLPLVSKSERSYQSLTQSLCGAKRAYTPSISKACPRGTFWLVCGWPAEGRYKRFNPKYLCARVNDYT